MFANLHKTKEVGNGVAILKMICVTSNGRSSQAVSPLSIVVATLPISFEAKPGEAVTELA